VYPAIKVRRLLLIVLCAAAAGSCRGTAAPVSATTPTTTPPAPTSCAPAFELDRDLFDEDGGQASMTITAASTCGWQIAAPEWVSVTPSTAGTGNARVTVLVKAFAVERDATIAIGERASRIRQRPVGPIEPPVFRGLCRRQGKPGDLVIGGCVIAVTLGSGRPSSSGVQIRSDMRAFGLSANYGWVYITASAGEFEVDFRIPPNFPIGPVDIPVQITDLQGRVVNTTVVFQVVG
jgi:hypothetical protein